MKAEAIFIVGNTKDSGYKEEKGVAFFHIPCLLPIGDIFFINPPGSFNKVKKVLETQKIDLVHIHGPLFTFYWGVIRKLPQPCVLTTHYVLDFQGNKILSFLYRTVIKWLTKTAGKHVDKIICVNKKCLSIYERWGVDREKLVHIPNGIDTDLFSPGNSDVKKKLQCKHLVIFWGRLSYQKNVQLLIKAFKKVTIPETKLVIVGKGPDLKRLKRLANDTPEIIFTDFLPDEKLVEYARGADVAVLPSRGESWGLVIGEAMACGLPVITPNVGEARELIGQDRGIILEDGSANEMARTIEYMLSHEKLGREMGEKACAFIQNRYDWKKIRMFIGWMAKTHTISLNLISKEFNP